MRLLDLLRRRHGRTLAGERNGEGGRPIREPSARATNANLLRGDALLADEAYPAALDAYREAIDAGLGAPAHLGQARAYLALGQRQDAADSLEVALAIDRHNLDAVLLLADIRLQSGDVTEALSLLQDAVDAAPDRADLHFKLGLALNQSGDAQSAAVAYRTAIRLDPQDPAPHVNLGLIAMQHFGHAEEAERAFRHALRLAPRDLAAMANLGLALQDQGRHIEALALYEQGLVIHPDAVELRWNRGIANLSLGRFVPGWDGYELRLQRTGRRDTSSFPFPDWDGQPVVDGALLVLAEQGLGDEVMFASCVPDLRALAHRVVLECAPRLAPLFRRSFPWLSVHGVDRGEAPAWVAEHTDIRAKTPIGSLPRRLRRSAAQFPVHSGYLRPEPERVASFKQRLRALGGRCVGVSWRGGTRTTRGPLRSIPIERLRLLQGIPDTTFVCLQHDPTEAERAIAREIGILVWDEIAADLDAAAALISALDLVVCVPNTNAHLAGALGSPVWVLLNAAPEWRWQAAGIDSPWYPSARLLRAKHANDWDDVLAEVRRLLEGGSAAMAAGSPVVEA